MNDIENRYQIREMLSFQMAYNKKGMISTWILGLFIIGIFILEEVFGGSENISVLTRMGANVALLVKDQGEYYRLLSSVFLHAGYLHVFFNTYVLFALGGFFNKVLGEMRYLFIFFISGITGSLSSIFLGKSQISVGASGAIWGLFGASLVLAYFKTGYLPEAFRLRLKKITLINLLINIGVSFLPMVDFWAHIGGGVGGFLAALLVVFEPRSSFLWKLKNILLKLAVALLIGVYAYSISMAIYEYKPWRLSFNFSFVDERLKDVPFTVKIPEGFKLEESKKSGRNIYSYSFGDLKFDQIVVEYFFFEEQSISLSDDWIRSQYELFLADDTFDKDLKKSLTLIQTTYGLILSYEKRAGGGHKIITYLLVKDNYVIRTSLIVSEKITNKQIDSLRENLLSGIRRVD